MADRPITFLCLASEFKGLPFLHEAKRQGCRNLLVVAEKHADAPWPWEVIDEVFRVPDLSRQPDITYAVSYLTRARHLDRIVALDDFDVETAADLREHLRVPGMGHTTARHFRDKLAMRVTARAEGFLVPAFAPVFNYEDLAAFMQVVSPPWVLKPRFEAGAVGIRKVHDPEAVWRTLDELGDKQSYYLIEQFVAGDVFHVDSLVWDREIVFSLASQYGRPPLAVSHGGGVFTSRTLPADSTASQELLETNGRLLAAFGLVRGVNHAEYIRGEDGHFYFLENAARVAGANLDRLVFEASGIDLWAEAARIEIADVRGVPYELPATRGANAGIITCLAHQEWPDLSGYEDPEVVWRLRKSFHASLVAASPQASRVAALLDSYVDRFAQDFLAVAPPKSSERF